MSHSKMYKFSGSQFRDAFIKGDLSALEIAEYSIRRIENEDHKTGAFLAIFKERLLRKAAALDHKRKEGKPLGKLAGIPIGIKDNLHITGELTTCGSRMLENYRAVFDSTATRLLEEEDALLLGKTNMDEFAMGSSTERSAFHPTKNPWALNSSPGGSSGGSAAAVAARFCPISLGSDTGGSVRQPAAFTGVLGYKPTYGRISRYGLVAFASSFDQIGPFGHCAEDIALSMEVLGQHCKKDATSLPLKPTQFVKELNKSLKGVKIGVPWKFLEDLQSETKQSFLDSIAVLKELGAEILEVDLSYLKYSVAIYYIVATAEASTNLARFDGIRYGYRSKRATNLDEIYDFSRNEGFGAEVKQRILLGTYVLSSGYQDAYYKKAQKVRALIINQYNEAFAQCSLIAMPTSPFPAFELNSIQDPLQMYLQDIYTIGANLAGLPAISVPSGFTKQGKPLGLQFSGPLMHDGAVISAAYAFEQATGFNIKIPPEFDHG